MTEVLPGQTTGTAPVPLRRIRSARKRTPLDWAELWRYLGKIREVRLYTAGVAMATTTDEVDLTPLPRAKRTAAQCTGIQVSAVDGFGVPLDAIVPGTTVQVTVTVTATAPVSRAFLGVEVMDERGRPAIGISTDMADGWISLDARQSKRVTVRLHDVQVRPGIYAVGLILTTVTERLDGLDAVVRFEVMPSTAGGYDRWPGWLAAAYAPRFSVEIL
ncbi:MAG: Wzt carbohydrate-binding domain-containing protein [Gemmatimonadaceae bacterium]